MSVPTNEVIAEQVKQLRKEFNEFRKDTREQVRELEQDLEVNQRSTNELNFAMSYVKDTVKEMKDMLNNFVKVQNEQTQQINDFIHSDKRRDSKRQFWVAIAQVGAGIIIAVLGLMASGKL